jgi:phosphonate transport system ATP-binding protein
MIFQQHQLIARQSVLANVLLGRIGYHPAWRTMFPLPYGERRIALECQSASVYCTRRSNASIA